MTVVLQYATGKSQAMIGVSKYQVQHLACLRSSGFSFPPRLPSFSVCLGEPALSEPTTTHASIYSGLLPVRHWAEDFVCLVLFNIYTDPKE